MSADGYVQTGQGMLDKNMFAYCANNPIRFRDPSGCYYEISIPAQGDGDPEITVKDEPNYYRVTREGNTYTVTKHNPTIEEKNLLHLFIQKPVVPIRQGTVLCLDENSIM